MAIANLTELFGNSSANTNTIPNLSVYYGLGGDDNLSSPSGNSNSFPVVVAIGGAGNDVYTVWNNSTLIVWDSSSSGSDRLVATGIPLITGNTIGANYGGIIDNRHLWVGNTVSGQEIIILDWQNQRNRLETINLQDGDFSYDFIAETIPTLGLPSYSWSSAVAAGLDLSKLGLNSSHVNTAIEQIKNRSLEIQQPDFSDDGKSDILLNNPTQGWNTAWLMDGTNYAGYASVFGSAGYRPVATADFNKDGKTDLVVNNPTNNFNSVWFMDGGNYVSGVGLPTAAGWQIKGAADFNGDGNTDILLNNTTTNWNTVWFLGGANGASYTGFGNLPVANGWNITGVADFNGDGNSDILLNNPSQGWNTVWFLNGTTYSGFANLPSAQGWQSLGTGDFNNDGKPDIILNNLNSNWNTVWLMNGTNYVDFANLPTAPAGWQIAGMA
ncbi:FG-GAP repeat domain-containing protein [Sphaerospermopsis torques-reginae]|uniref:FG-GAP repeat domain-containing protein n=1 Tax=Sphaerospermopsis torques-reginae TaxID=984207 RepID=UPI001FE7181C|nr:VCBS repeat-containing protein [Sphaerospermopsis torques-reginae]